MKGYIFNETIQEQIIERLLRPEIHLVIAGEKNKNCKSVYNPEDKEVLLESFDCIKTR